MQQILITMSAAAKVTNNLMISDAYDRLIRFLMNDNIKEVLQELSAS